MKKYLFILGLVGTALFSACSTADDLVSEKPNEAPPVEEPKETAIIVEASQDSEEPITLGIGQSRGYTRTPLDTDVDEGFGNFKTESNRFIGVFCLATGTQTGVSNIPDAVASNHWSADASGGLGGLLVKLKDVPAIVRYSSSTYNFKFWNTTTGKEEHYFYPMSNWMKYNFYAYYPQFNSSTIEIGEDGNKSKVEVTGYEIDGSQDLIWGMSDQVPESSVSGADPYSAKFSRLAKKKAADESGDISAYYPEFKFKHQLVQFNIYVKAVDASALSSLQAVQAKVIDMYVDNAIYKLKFCVASQADDFNDCQLAMDGDLASVTKKLGIKKKSTNDNIFDGSAYLVFKSSDADVSTDDYNIGYVGYIMLPSPPTYKETDINPFKYRLVMKIGYDGSSNTDEVGVELKPPAIPGTDPVQYGFIAGKKYNVIVRVQSPEEISAKAVLMEWGTGSTIECFTE